MDYRDFNTIILLHGENRLTKMEYRTYKKEKGSLKGESIWGENENPEEIRRWNIKDREEAINELKKYKCEYEWGAELFFADEYALQYCKCDDDGEILYGSDFDLAEEKRE